MPSYLVEVECKVVKELYLVDCPDKFQAENNPWEYAKDECELTQIDWEVISVRKEEESQ